MQCTSFGVSPRSGLINRSFGESVEQSSGAHLVVVVKPGGVLHVLPPLLAPVLPHVKVPRLVAQPAQQPSGFRGYLQGV